MKEIKGREKDLESQLKLLKDELARKKDLIQNLRDHREQSELEASKIIHQMDQSKGAQDRVAKLMKETNRKDQVIKEQRMNCEQIRATAKDFENENIKLSEKVKQLKADVGRKEKLLKDAREKVDNVQKEYSGQRDKVEEIDRFRDLLKKSKHDIDRKDVQIKSLRSKLDQTELEKESV